MLYEFYYSFLAGQIALAWVHLMVYFGRKVRETNGRYLCIPRRVYEELGGASVRFI